MEVDMGFTTKQTMKAWLETPPGYSPITGWTCLGIKHQNLTCDAISFIKGTIPKLPWFTAHLEGKSALFNHSSSATKPKPVLVRHRFKDILVTSFLGGGSVVGWMTEC